MAEQQGVTTEYFLAIVEARKAVRRAKMFRRRSRRRHLLVNAKAARRPMLQGEAHYAAEGEFAQLLRMAGMTHAQFGAISGIRPEQVSRWYGHPLHGWPIELLRNYLWAHKMAKALSDRGIDPEQFKPALPDRVMPTGRYPRKGTVEI